MIEHDKVITKVEDGKLVALWWQNKQTHTWELYSVDKCGADDIIRILGEESMRDITHPVLQENE